MDKILSKFSTNRGKICIVVILIYLIIIVIFLVIKLVVRKKHKISWSRNRCFYATNQTFDDIFNKYNIGKNDDKWQLFLPCNYDEINKEIDQLPVKENAKYFIVANTDEMVAKELLWKNVVLYHGLEKALTMMPQSYILYDPEDVKKFERNYVPNKIYIMKKNIQRQEGLKITKNKNEIVNGFKNGGYVVVQELLQNPYIIDGRKTNMRFYILVTVINNNLKVYVYNDGFMYYTKDNFVKNSTEAGPNITTGYIDRSVYDKNPLTHTDLVKYLDTHEKPIENRPISATVFERIYFLLSQVYASYYGKLNAEKLKNNLTFQLYGIDIAFSDKFEPVIIEINKGPDMDAKDKRDAELKHNVVEDILITVGIVDQPTTERENGFIKLIDM